MYENIDAPPEGVSYSNKSADAFVGLGQFMDSATDNFHKSGGSDFVSNISATMTQETRDYISETRKSHIFNYDQLRSLMVFFGMGEERPFYFESSLIFQRVPYNLSFFYFNYILMTVILFAFTVMVNPFVLLSIAGLGFVWLRLLVATKDGARIQILFVSLTQKQTTLAMAVISVIVLIWLFKGIFWWTFLSANFLTASHAILRNVPTQNDGEYAPINNNAELNNEYAFLYPPSNTEYGYINPT